MTRSIPSRLMAALCTVLIVAAGCSGPSSPAGSGSGSALVPLGFGGAPASAQGGPRFTSGDGITITGLAIAIEPCTNAGEAQVWNGAGFVCTHASSFLNSAGANVLAKSDGTNIVASSGTDDGATVEWSPSSVFSVSQLLRAQKAVGTGVAGTDYNLSVNDLTAHGTLGTGGVIRFKARVSGADTTGSTVALIRSERENTNSGDFASSISFATANAAGTMSKACTISSAKVLDCTGGITDTSNRVFSIAGSGLTSSAATVNVGAGTGITVNADDVAITTNGVTNALLRQSSGLSVIGRSANTTGNVADITAVTDGHVLRLSGTTLGFGTVATAGISDNAVTYAKMQDVTATARFIGRITAGAGDPEELTGTQATTLLDTFTTGLKGVVAASGGGTTNFLRADDTWVDVETAAEFTAAISGTNNTTAKFTGTNTIGNAWALDDGTTWGVSSKFTITEASGNFRTFGTATVDGNTTLGVDQTKVTTVNGYGNVVGTSGGKFIYLGDLGTNYGVIYDSGGKLRIGGAATVGGVAAIESLEIDPNAAAVTALGTLTVVTSTTLNSSSGTTTIRGAITAGANSGDATDNSFQGTTRFKTTGADTNALVRIQNDAQIWQLGVRGASADQLIVRDESAGVDVMSFLKVATGNTYVGIGSSAITPIAPLDINTGNAGQTTAALTDAGDRSGLVFLQNGATSAGGGGGLVFGNSQSHTANAVGFAALKGLLTNGSGNTTGDLAFSTRNATTDTALVERMRIAASGAVTIQQTLAVTGAITEGGTAVLSGAITANVIPKGSGGNLADSSITDNGSSVFTVENVFAGLDTGSGAKVFNVGRDTTLSTNAQNGYSVTTYSDGNNYVDTKTITSGHTFFRLGSGAQTGAATTWLDLNHVGPVLTFTGNTTFNDNVTLGNASGDAHTVNGTAWVFDTIGTTVASTINGLTSFDDTAFAAGVGGSLAFGGKYNAAGNYEWGASIRGAKTNATDGNNSFDLVLSTKPNAGTIAERMRISDQGTTTITGPSSGAPLIVTDATQATERIRFAGQEFFQAAHTDTNGPTLLLGVNRSANRQIYLADSAALTQNSTNLMLAFSTGTTGLNSIDSLATDGTTAKSLFVNPTGGGVRVGSTTTPIVNLDVTGTIRTVVAGGSAGLVVGTSSKQWTAFPDTNGPGNLSLFAYTTTYDAGGGSVRASFPVVGGIATGDTSLSAIDNNVDVVTIGNTGTSQTSDGKALINASSSATYNTTAGAIQAWGAEITLAASRASGANNFNQVGVRSYVSSGQNQNVAGEFNASGAAQNIGVVASGTQYSVFGSVGTMYNAGALQIDNSSTLGDNDTNDAVTIHGRLLGTTTSQDSNPGVLWTSTPSALANDVVVAQFLSAGTVNATAAGRTVYGVYGQAATSRSAGANNVSNIAGFFNAANGQINYALYTSSGDNALNVIAGTTGIGITPQSTSKLSVAQAVGAAFTQQVSDITIRDTTSSAKGVGGMIEFQGAWSGASQAAVAGIKAMKSNGIDGQYDFDLVFGVRRNGDPYGNVMDRRLIIDATGATNMLGEGVGVGGVHASYLGADYTDVFYSGLSRKNLSLYSAVVGDDAATDGHWRHVNGTATLVYATDGTQTPPRGFATNVGKITCTGATCTSSGAYYGYVATSATTFITDLRNKTMTFSVFLKMASGTNAALQIGLARYNDNDVGFGTCTVNSTTFTRCSFTRTFNNTNLTDNSELRAYIYPQSTTAVYIDDAQIELGFDPTPIEDTTSNIGGHAAAYNPFPLSAYSAGAGGDLGYGTWTYSAGFGNSSAGLPAAMIGPAGDYSGRSLSVGQSGSGSPGGTTYFGVDTELTNSWGTGSTAYTVYGIKAVASPTRSSGTGAITAYAGYFDSQNAQTTWAIYADHGNVKVGATSGSFTSHGAAIFDNTLDVTGITTLGTTNTGALSTTTISAGGTVTLAGTSTTFGGGSQTTHTVYKDGTARPTLANCGTGASVVGNDASGLIITGTTPGACTLTFNATASSNASCTVTARDGTFRAYAVSTTTLSFTTVSASQKYDYMCSDH
jgi:hypothetical protein